MFRYPVNASLLFVALAAATMLPACTPRVEPQTQPAAATAAPSLPAPVAQDEDARTFAIGSLSATALRDGALEFPNDNKVFGVGRSPEDVAALLAAAGAPTDKLHLSVQPLLVKSADRVLLFDTGAGSNFGPTAGHLSAALAAAGVDPKSVTDIFVSHAHGDHIGGLVNAGGALVFPNATIHLSAPEWTFLQGLGAEKAKDFGINQYSALIATIAPKVATFAPGSEIVPGMVKAVEIKGHTPGHSGYLISSGKDSLLYVGDSMHHYVVSVQKPEWIISFDGDTTTGAASRSALVAQLAASGQRIYAVHFPFPGIGKIEKRGEGFVWVGE